ncbi:hypothetical protein CH272_04595 [Rhodococcus sp. 05-340-1]|nr:hypothetical protein CH271_26490 [Rhodococcus sp. 05-340-2]OZD82497.1 hypothetical protein CH272_04595 [Rhodococcus sp. 05-340-1]
MSTGRPSREVDGECIYDRVEASTSALCGLESDGDEVIDLAPFPTEPEFGIKDSGSERDRRRVLTSRDGFRFLTYYRLPNALPVE